MKYRAHILSVLFLLLASAPFQSQTNLEYSETTTIQFSGTTSTNYSIVTYTFTVPEGQTWKIESVLLTRKTQNGLTRDYNTSTDLKLILDDNLFYITSSTYRFDLPYWLPSGEHTFELLYTNTWSATYTGMANLSVLVFNEVEE